MGPSYSAAATGGQNGLYNESYTYNSTTGNLASKAGVSYTYDTNHPHAVASLSNGNSYTYDANGNMTQRVVNGQTFNLSYDAENRMVGVSKTGLSATFVYDADGKRVQSTINNVTTKFIGSHYEIEGTTVRKYYFAGSTGIFSSGSSRLDLDNDRLQWGLGSRDDVQSLGGSALFKWNHPHPHSPG
jgi:YD repeat-containing protein